MRSRPAFRAWLRALRAARLAEDRRRNREQELERRLRHLARKLVVAMGLERDGTWFMNGRVE